MHIFERQSSHTRQLGVLYIFVELVLCLAIILFNLIESQTWWINSWINHELIQSLMSIMGSRLKNKTQTMVEGLKLGLKDFFFYVASLGPLLFSFTVLI